MDATLFERELVLESEMIDLGANRVWKAVLKARERHEESSTPYGKRLLVVALDQFAETLKVFMTTTGSGPKHSAIGPFKLLDAHVLAFIIMQGVIDSISLKKPYTAVAVSIGRRIEDELRFNVFAEKNKPFWETLRKDLAKREQNMKRRRGILKHEMKKAAQLQRDLQWEGWEAAKRLVVGSVAIDLFIQATGIVQRVQIGKGGKKQFVIAATPLTGDFIKELVEEKSGVMSPVLLPTIIPPRRWVNPYVGGYHMKTLRPIPLIKAYGPRGTNYLEELANRVDTMPMVYDAVNAVQATPWKINKALHDVMEQAYKGGLEIGDDMPSALDTPLPLQPIDIATNGEARKIWSRQAAQIYSSNAQRFSRRVQLDKVIWLAEKFRGEEAIYFPMQLDFRGRMYAMPSFLNPQGNDPAKALLTFVRGKRLGATGWRWLHIHIANVWGEDKVSLDARFQWTVANYHWIVDCVAQPFAERRWMDADKPWQFLAGAMELVAAIKHGMNEDYISSLPVSVDGTCNGLQHFGAMLLCEQTAEAVNLSPSATPQDIYQRVADRTRIRIQKDALDGLPLAQEWLDWGFDRKACKRSVMITPYSGTLYAAKDYTRDYIKKRKGCPWEDTWEPSIYFAKHTWAAIAETVTSAKLAMNWFRKVAGVVSAHGVPMIWTTPVGFPVRQDYRNMTSYQVNTRLGDGTRYSPRLEREAEGIDKRGQEQAIAPNVVHSLDAACLMLTMCRSVDEGIHDFAMVHDSYGVVAADMEIMYAALRQAFVDIYQNDVMQQFLDSTTSSLSEEERKKLPPIPAKGSFKLESVKESKYFFA